MTTCSCAELDERYDGKGVTLAGMIAGSRTINTKKGDQMAFVQLEDMGGQCEVVFFPRRMPSTKRCWSPTPSSSSRARRRHARARPACLADSFQNYVDQIISVGPDPQYQKPLLELGGPTINGFRSGEGSMDDSNDDGIGQPGDGRYGADSFGLGGFGNDDDFLPGDEENPFRFEPPAWIAAEVTPHATAPAAHAPAKNAVEEAAPDNPYLHESHSLRAEDDDREIPLPASLRDDSDLAAALQAATSAQTEALPPVQIAPEAAAPDNPYLHESRSFHAEDDDREIPLPASLRDDPSILAEVAPDPAPKAAPTPEAKPVPAEPTSASNGNGHHKPSNGRSQATGKPTRTLQIVFRPSGDLERDKFRLKEIVDAVRDPPRPRPIQHHRQGQPPDNDTRFPPRPVLDQRQVAAAAKQILPRGCEHRGVTPARRH